MKRKKEKNNRAHITRILVMYLTILLHYTYTVFLRIPTHYVYESVWVLRKRNIFGAPGFGQNRLHDNRKVEARAKKKKGLHNIFIRFLLNFFHLLFRLLKSVGRIKGLRKSHVRR